MTAFLIEFHGGPFDGNVRQVPYTGSSFMVTTRHPQREIETIAYRYVAYIELDDVTILIAQYP